MRIAIAGISHETNTYCREPTTTAAFHVLRGDRLAATAGQETDVGGMVSAVLAQGDEPVPLMACMAQPSGTIERATYDAFQREILAGLTDSQPDAVLLALHGAGVVDGIDDLEGDLCVAVRAVVGPDVPVIATFDLHGNVTQTMADALDGVFACHQYPHVDMHLRSEEAAQLAARLARRALSTAVHVEPVPMLMPTTTTFEGAGLDMLNAMLAAEQTVGVVDVSWFHGFPYTDVPHVGSSVCVTADDATLARSTAVRMAERLWSARASFVPVSLSAEQALAAAADAAARPVIVNETSDNPGAGTPGDGTHLLRAMLDAGLERACFGFIVDPVAARVAHDAGVGAHVELALGGHYDDLHGETLNVSGVVRALHDGDLVLQAMFRGAPLRLGPMARITIDGVDVVVASRRSQTFDPEPFLALGIDVSRYDVVALKSSNHFRAGFRDVAGTIVTADTPGLSTHQIGVFPRRRAQAPLWPVDPGATYPLV